MIKPIESRVIGVQPGRGPSTLAKKYLHCTLDGSSIDVFSSAAPLWEVRATNRKQNARSCCRFIFCPFCLSIYIYIFQHCRRGGTSFSGVRSASKKYVLGALFVDTLSRRQGVLPRGGVKQTISLCPFQRRPAAVYVLVQAENVAKNEVASFCQYTHHTVYR